MLKDGPIFFFWRVILLPKIVSWWWIAVKSLWLFRMHCWSNKEWGHKFGSGQQRIKLLGRMAGSCRHGYLLTLKWFHNKWAETETILFSEAISCKVWQCSGQCWCLSLLMSSECPIKLGYYRTRDTGTIVCMNDSPNSHWMTKWMKLLVTLRLKQSWQCS